MRASTAREAIEECSGEEQPECGGALSRLLEPVPVSAFLDHYTDRAPLRVHRSDPGRYSDLLTLSQLGDLLSVSGPGYENVSVVSGGFDTLGKTLGKDPAYGYGETRTQSANRLEAIYQRYRQGSTIVLNSMHERNDRLRGLERELSAELSAAIEMNAYVTPGGGFRGFTPHYDAHDVLILQIHGSKRWQLYGSPFPLPLPTPDHDFRLIGPGLRIPEIPEEEFTLEAGDLLYLPRGVLHAASSGDSTSAHLTIGVHQASWLSLIEQTIRDLGSDHVALRVAARPGFAVDERSRAAAVDELRSVLSTLFGLLSPEEIVDRLAARTISVGSPDLADHITDLECINGITIATAVYRRSHLRHRIVIDGPKVRLEFHNKALEFPGRIAASVEFLAQLDEPVSFTAADIPGTLDESGRLVLVRTLVREGFLTLS